MDDLTMWSLLVGAILPPLIAVIQQPKWSDRARALTTVLVCLVAGSGTAYFSGDMAGRSWVSSVLVCLVTALSTYRGVWRPTGVAPAIESATGTSVARAREDA